jgi:hypothetical protein
MCKRVYKLGINNLLTSDVAVSKTNFSAPKYTSRLHPNTDKNEYSILAASEIRTNVNSNLYGLTFLLFHDIASVL